MQTKREGIEKPFKDYFEGISFSPSPFSEDIEVVLDTVEVSVTTQMNEELGKSFIVEEIDEALSQMSPLKSPGPDGFGAGFYKKYWSIVKEERYELQPLIFYIMGLLHQL